MYAVTPCHAGSGSSVGVVDLPIQRERHTNWPIIQASGMKGAIRAHFDRFKNALQDQLQEDQFANITEIIFGSEKSAEYAGAVSVGDAKILAFPMRSNVAPFVWITCPAVLKRLNKDLALAGRKSLDLQAIENLEKEQALWLAGKFKENGRVLLEDMEVSPVASMTLPDTLKCFKDTERLLVVHDEVFDYGVSNCTSVMAQIKIDQKTGTTDGGSLRYQEELPADSLLYSLIFWGDSCDPDSSQKAETIRSYIEKEVVAEHLQVGGDETMGRGIFSLNWL